MRYLIFLIVITVNLSINIFSMQPYQLTLSAESAETSYQEFEQETREEKILKLREQINSLINSNKKISEIKIQEILMYSECTDLLELLIEKGLDVNSKMGFLKTSMLEVAIENKNTNALLCLLKRGANPNAYSIVGDTALFKAIVKKDISSIRILLDYKANPNFQNVFGITPITWTFLYLRSLSDEPIITKIVHLLLIRGANTYIMRSNNDDYIYNGQNAIKIAKIRGFKNLAYLMETYTPEAPTLKTLCLRFITRHKNKFSKTDFEILPIDLKKELNLEDFG